jgi:N-acetylmuramoyl-L-alanine amidase
MTISRTVAPLPPIGPDRHCTAIPTVPTSGRWALNVSALLAVALAVLVTAAPVGAAGGSPLAPLRGATIVVDPGHNPGNVHHLAEISRLVNDGNGQKACDTTGTATASGVSEARYTWLVSARVAALLRRAGARVVLTRTATRPAWGPCITQRAAIGNRVHADAAVSIHGDGGPPSGRGFFTIAPSAPLPAAWLTAAMVARDVALAVAVRDAYGRATGLPTSSYAGHAGVLRSDGYGGTNLSRVPKIFIETGNLRNAQDAALLLTPAFQAREAAGIVRGIADYLARR